MGVSYNDDPVSDLKIVVRILKREKRNVEILTWPNGKVLFYYNPSTNDIVYPNDLVYTYLVGGKPTTPLELIQLAKTKGYVLGERTHLDTRGAAKFIKACNISITKNPNPTKKFTGQENP